MLEFNPPTTSTSASSMLSMLNLNMEAVSRQNFLLGASPPLAALHTMAEIKASTLGPYCGQVSQPNSVKSSIVIPASSATPHGINDILSRPTMTSPSTLGTLGATLPRFSLGVGPGMYFSHANPGLHKLGLGDIPGRPSHMYWPTVNPLWRDRLAAPHGRYFKMYLFDNWESLLNVFLKKDEIVLNILQNKKNLAVYLVREENVFYSVKG